MSAAFSTSSWARHESALASYRTFRLTCSKPLLWPIYEEDLAAYIVWAHNNHKLKAKTIAAYVSSLKCLHLANGLSSTAFSSSRISYLLKGAENLEIYWGISSSERKAMSFPLLQILGHGLASSSLHLHDRQAMWAACCIAFYGSLRLGEILSHREKSFHPVDSFLWSDVQWAAEDHLVLQLRNTKVCKHETVDIFSVPSNSSCPIKAMRKYEKLSGRTPDKPVFHWLSGVFMTVREVNKLISACLGPHIGSSASQISGHSFRAALPSRLAKYPELTSSDEIMGWGRWRSSAYLSYTRLKSDQRRKVFDKVLSLLLRDAGSPGST